MPVTLAVSLAPIDRLLPRRPSAFLALVTALASGSWVLGSVLSPDKGALLASPEWLVQPFYIAAHLIALRMFITIYTRNFRAGVLHFDVPFAQATRGVRPILGLPGAVAALVIATPFCLFDYAYLRSERYATLMQIGADGVLRPIDYELWGIWCLEWFLNALMWVILVGFLLKNCSAIRAFAFRSPIDIVLREKHYKPFLRMSAQGATVVLLFSACTVIYVLLTGGETSDYLGLAITSALLVVGFVPPWIMVNAKIDSAVRGAMADLRQKLPQGLTAASWSSTGAAGTSLEHRLDEVLVLLRLSHLENLSRTPGQSEAKAIAFRLLTAPAATAAWQLSQKWSLFVSKLHVVLGGY